MFGATDERHGGGTCAHRADWNGFTFGVHRILALVNDERYTLE